MCVYAELSCESAGGFACMSGAERMYVCVCVVCAARELSSLGIKDNCFLFF